MDKIDKKILAELQADGRLSVTELAHKVGLSLSPCHRRVKALEDTGIIKGYRAQLDISQLGLNFSTIVFVTLKNGDKDSVQSLEEAILKVPQIVKAQRRQACHQSGYWRRYAPPCARRYQRAAQGCG